MQPPRGIEPRPRPYQGRMLPLSPWRRGASGRTRTGHHQLGRLRSCHWTTLALVRPTGIESLHAGDVACSLHTPAEHGPVSFTGPSTSSVVKDPALASWWAARDSNPIAPWGERGYGPSADHPLVPPDGDSARIRTWIPEFWRLGCFRYTTLSMHVSNLRRHNLLATWPGLPRGPGQTKKAFQGIALEGLVLQRVQTF